MNSEGQKYFAVRQSVFFGSDYFTKWIDFKKQLLPQMIEDAANPLAIPKRRAQYIFDIFLKRLELLIECYSRGDPIDEVSSHFPDMVECLEWAYEEELKVFTTAEMAMRTQFGQNLDIYVIFLWLASLAICLDVSDDLLKRILRVCGNEGEDWLFEKIISSRIQGRKQTSTVLYPQTYNLLKFAIQESRPAERNRLLRGFVQKWYPSLSNTYWHDCHEGPDGGGYFGYWCFELAAAVKMFKLDDSAVIDSPYYPKDLVR